MGRRSLKRERTEQILDGFERSVAANGLAGTTLERVAEFAGLGRPAIRHNIGNRDAVIEAALERFVARHKERYRAATLALPDEGRVDALLDYLFLGPFAGPVDAEDAVLDELFALRHRSPRAAALLSEAYRDLEQTLSSELSVEYPSATSAVRRGVAYQLMALAYGHSTFAGLGNGRRRGPMVLALARQVVATLAA